MKPLKTAKIFYQYEEERDYSGYWSRIFCGSCYLLKHASQK